MDTELIVDKNPKSPISEAIKNIRTNLQFSSVDGEVKNILVTSSAAGEGKSFISSNLAVAFAKLGHKVLIVDCDLRLGRQHKIFNVSNESGLSNLLITDVSKKYKSFIQNTDVENVSILTRGVVPPNPSELLASDKNKQLVKLLSKKFDYIIWDGVPIMGLTDSRIMADLVDKIVIVSAYKITPLELLKNTNDSLGNFKNKIAGVVLNGVPMKGNHYYYYSKNYLN